MTVALPLAGEANAPRVALGHLDDLWFQVSGTLCNLHCSHCFISCHPHNHSFGFLDLATVTRVLDDAVALGVKEYYFTGGEPFLNRDLVAMLERTLLQGPATVLTNGTIVQEAWLARLRRADEASPYSLEFRISLDGFTAEENDPIRGAGTFERILHGIRVFVAHGFLPIITVTRTRDDQDDVALVEGFAALLRSQGYARPRLKLLPTLRIGAEAQRQRGYNDDERVTPEMMAGFDAAQLLCQHGRIVTDRGIYACPILIEAPAARMGDTVAGSLGPVALSSPACHTCYQYGALCSNASGARRDA